MKITFDSNVWRIVASPENFPREASIDSFRIINETIRNGRARGFLAETVFTLEAIKKTDRKAFFACYKSKVDVKFDVTSDGAIGLNFQIGPDPSAHPGSNNYLAAHLKDALELSFKLMRFPRIAGVVNPDLRDEWFVHMDGAELKARQKLTCAIGRQIKDRGCGMTDLISIGQKYAPKFNDWRDSINLKDKNWQEGIKLSPDSENTPIAKAIAEWADGDAVAMHIGYKNDFFCTRDVGVSGGANSILAPANRAWLASEYGVVFVTPEELAQKLDEMNQSE